MLPHTKALGSQILYTHTCTHTHAVAMAAQTPHLSAPLLPEAGLHIIPYRLHISLDSCQWLFMVGISALQGSVLSLLRGGLPQGVPNLQATDWYPPSDKQGFGLEIKFTIKVMPLNHPQTIPPTLVPWKNCLPQSLSLVPKGLGTTEPADLD